MRHLNKLERSLIAFCTMAAFLGAMLIAGGAQATKSGDVFVEKATIAGQFEISSSRLALQNSQNQDIKDFAQQMIDDHTKASNDLKAAVTTAGVSPSQPTPSMDSTHQKELDKLNKLSGKDFDKEYVKVQVSAHNDAVKLFKDYSKNGDQDALRDFATKTLPTLQEHQQHIKEIKSSM